MLTKWLESGITQKQSALADLAIKRSCQWGLREALARTIYVALPGGLSVWTSCGFLTAWWLASKRAKWRFIFMTSLWKPRSTPLAMLGGSKESQRGENIDNLLAPHSRKESQRDSSMGDVMVIFGKHSLPHTRDVASGPGISFSASRQPQPCHRKPILL